MDRSPRTFHIGNVLHLCGLDVDLDFSLELVVAAAHLRARNSQPSQHAAPEKEPYVFRVQEEIIEEKDVVLLVRFALSFLSSRGK